MGEAVFITRHNAAMKQPDHKQIAKDIENALQEDVGTGDLTASLIPENTQVRAQIIAREPAVFCGILWANEAFTQLSNDIQLDWQTEDGLDIKPDEVLCEISGPAQPILTAERTALNFLQTLSATATATRSFVDKLRGTQTDVVDTRKTLPGLRAAQKYAVTQGGGVNHRFGLYDAILIKENHILACGSLKAAIDKARTDHPDVPLQVEAENLTEVEEALIGRPDLILLDNFETHLLARATNMVKEHKRRGGNDVLLEASGNIDLNNVREIADTGVNRVSIGGLTKHVRAIDLSLRFKQ